MESTNFSEFARYNLFHCALCKLWPCFHSFITQCRLSRMLQGAARQKRNTKVHHGMWWMAKPGWAYCSLNNSCPAIHMQLRVYCLSVVHSTIIFKSENWFRCQKEWCPSSDCDSPLSGIYSYIFTKWLSVGVCCFFTLVFSMGPEPTRNTEDIFKLSPGDFRPKIMFQS